MIAVAVVAAWLAFAAYGDRLRELSITHTHRSAEARAEAARERPWAPNRPTPLSDWHLRMAEKYHVEADFVESVFFTVPLAAAIVGLVAPIVVSARKRQRPSALTPAD
jgi:hypothetical protein